MTPSPLQLSDSVVKEVSLIATEEASKSFEVEVKAEPQYNRHATDLNKWMVELNVEFKGAKDTIASYSGKVVVVGYFSIDATLPEEKQFSIVAVNCPTMLYSTVREIVLSLSARGPHKKLVLPSVSFIANSLVAPEGEEKSEAVKS